MKIIQKNNNIVVHYLSLIKIIKMKFPFIKILIKNVTVDDKNALLKAS